MKYVTIIPPEPNSNGITKSQGTKVVSEGGEVHGIKSIKIKMGTGENITADIELFASFNEMRGVVPRYMMRHPITDKPEEIAAIQFVSGEILALCLSQNGERDITHSRSKSREYMVNKQ